MIDSLAIDLTGIDLDDLWPEEGPWVIVEVEIGDMCALDVWDAEVVGVLGKADVVDEVLDIGVLDLEVFDSEFAEL